MTRNTRKKIKATVAGGFSITEIPHNSSTIVVFGKSYRVRITLIKISSTTKHDFTYLYEGTVKVNGKLFTNSDFTLKRLLKIIKIDIESTFKKRKNAKRLKGKSA